MKTEVAARTLASACSGRHLALLGAATEASVMPTRWKGTPAGPTEPTKESPMPTLEEVARQPVEQRLARMERTADDFATAIHGVTEAVLSRRPDEKNWAAKEIVCHLRDIEELWTVRAQTVLLAEDQ